MSLEENIIVVRRFFKEVIDEGNMDLLEELFSEDCIIHRPNALKPLIGHDGIRGVITRAHQEFTDISTEIYDIFGDKRRIACRLSHSGTFKEEIYKSPLGEYPTNGKSVTWDAMAVFHFREGRCSEEWVNRNELAILIQIGAA